MNLRLLFPLLPLATLAGCATAPEPLAMSPPAPAIAVSCQTDAMSDHPCFAEARQACPDPAVDTIRLVLAKPVYEGERARTAYEYQATYSCPGGRATARAS